MAKRHHIFLGNSLSENIGFSVPSPHSTPVRNVDVTEQATKLRTAYTTAIETAKSEIASRARKGLPKANGYYLDFDIDKDSPMPYSQLDASNKGPKLMQVKLHRDKNDKIESQSVTIYLPKDHASWLDGKLDAYQNKKTSNDEPQNKRLINAIDNVKVAKARQLFPNIEEYDRLVPNTQYEFELWIDQTENEELEKTFSDVDRIGFNFNRDNVLRFELVTVILVKGTKEEVDDIPYVLNDVEAIKQYYNPAEMVTTNEENRDWNELLRDQIEPKIDDNSPRISIIDYGVNNAHPLLAQLLPNDRCKSVIDDSPLRFEDPHGTGMAGLALFGDLTDQMGNTGKLVVNHDLASVKLLSTRFANDPKLYGVLTQKAIEVSDESGAKIDCMAITDDKEYNDGTPTSWSAAIDNALYDNGECDRLMVLSAGNTQPDDIHHGHYMEDLNNSSIQSPCESLNAIVVGAYTVKVQCNRDGFYPEAPVDGISPMSRTSIIWKGKNVKPDIVMEGGNLSYHAVLGEDTMPELSLISTSSEIPQEPLQYFNATSASTALAARLAAKIKYANPELSMLSVRALIIHSAEWTDEMKKIDPKKANVMAYCGYGVPNESAAIASEDTAATFIFENELTPYQEGKDGNAIYKDMHFYDLPWPKDILLGMGAENVKMRVTLSYYIEPSPSQKGTYYKYRYQSTGLKFDVKTVNESKEQFIARHTTSSPVEDKSKNTPERWFIGTDLRSKGTVQSDWFECSAAELATCNEIVVYPTNGWWKNRKLENVDNKIKYSLVVTITTSETPIYDTIASLVKQKVETAVEG